MGWGGILIFLVIGIYLYIKFISCVEIHRERKVSLFQAILFGFVLPFGSVFIANKPLRSAWECEFCGNDKNEADYCGVCRRDPFGKERENFDND